MAENFDYLVVLDTETSGLNPETAQILTVDATALKKVAGGFMALGSFQGHVRFEGWAEVTEEALRVNRIDRETWEGEPEGVVMRKLCAWVNETTGGGYRTIAGYNVSSEPGEDRP